jgi:hypothetical protein
MKLLNILEKQKHKQKKTSTLFRSNHNVFAQVMLNASEGQKKIMLQEIEDESELHESIPVLTRKRV